VIWTFGEFELDDRQFVLRRGGEIVPLRRKVFDVLLHLVTHSETLVTKEQLLENVWPNETILEAVVPQNVAVLRQALGDTRGTGKVIQTVHGRGYRFVAKVESRDVPEIYPAALVVKRARAALVGRDQVLHELRTLFDDALAGSGQVAMLQGEPGIGKTRIAEELSREARERGALVLEGHCQDTAGALSYRPWIKLLRTLVEISASEPSVDVARLLGEAWAAGSQPNHSDPQAAAEARFRLFDSVTGLLTRACEAQPLLLVFDDLHWADQASLHMLRFVSRELRSLPVLLLGTTRPLDRGISAVAPGLLTELLTDTHVRRIPLAGLNQADTAYLIAATLGRELAPAMLSDVFALTEGNPFFVHELVRLLNESAMGHNDEQVRRELPRRIRDVIMLRLQRVGAEALRVLRLASVIGRDFNLAVLEAIAGLPRAQLFDVLASASEARLLREPGVCGSNSAPGWYGFSHALIQESLYGSLSPAERVRMHERVGHALEAVLGVDRKAHLDELAYHFHRGAVSGEIERAVDYCQRAAEQAFHQLAFEQAVTQYRAALEVLGLRLPVDEQRRYELKLGLGSALFRAGEDGNPALQDAAEVARGLRRPDLLARVVLSMAGWPRHRRRGRTDNPEFYPLLQEALAAPLEDQAGLRLKAQLLCALALNTPESTSLAEQIELSRRALALAREHPDDDAIYAALVARLRLMGGPADTERRLALTSELLLVAERSQQKERIFHAHELHIQPLIALGRLKRADQELERCAQLAAELRLPRFSLQVLRFRLQRALADGRFDEIRKLTKQAVIARGQAVASPGYLVGLFAWQSFERAQRGDRPWIERQIAALLPKIEQSNLLRAHVALLCAWFDRLEEARRCYRPLLDPRVLDDRDDEDWLMTLVWAAEAVVACNDANAARALYDRLIPFAELNVTHFEWFLYFGACSHWLGALAGVMGERSLAVEHFERAALQNTRLGALPASARTNVAYARVLLGREPGSSSLARARMLLDQAAAISSELGMAPLQREILSLRSALSTSHADATSG
jgi:DNA-binding winged helix-turn-helix (wHTH) protein